MIECVRRLQFCAGHRVLNHESKCRNPHGHNYVVHLHARAKVGHEILDDLGRVIDFSVLKDRIGSWIDKTWDHGFLVSSEDRQMIDCLRKMDARWMELPCNPTAENLARYLLIAVAPFQLNDTAVEIWKVTVEETENCSASATLVEELELDAKAIGTASSIPARTREKDTRRTQPGR